MGTFFWAFISIVKDQFCPHFVSVSYIRAGNVYKIEKDPINISRTSLYTSLANDVHHQNAKKSHFMYLQIYLKFKHFIEKNGCLAKMADG